LAVTVALVLFGGTPEAAAWGCDGHQAVAMIAERLLTPAAISAIKAVLAASPVDPAINPYCPRLPIDPIADAATWADDARALDPSTAGWHFLNFPIAAGKNTSDYKKYCPQRNCIIDAIVTQYRTLVTKGDARLRGNALRFVIHLIGDIHQPLHAVTNGDRGGNCLPVAYFNQPPMEDDRHNWRPNLHSVWDDSTIRTLMTTKGLENSAALADYIAAQSPLPAAGKRPPTAERVASWARDSAALARNVSYGKLQRIPPVAPAGSPALASCDDNNHVGQRMADLHDQIMQSYEQASVPVIVGQIRLAGERLAAVLKAAFPQ
jgi:hypothetical protein